MTETSPTDPVAALHAALAAFQAEMPVVGKTKSATIPGRDGKAGFSYSYADLADVTAKAIPALARHGLAFSCCPRVTDRGGYELVGVLTHTAGHRLEGALPLHGNDPRSLGSSITYARRYLLGCMTGVVTDDDVDGHDEPEPTRAAPPPYTGPSTETMLTELDELCRDTDVTYAEMMQPFLDNRGIDLDQLDRHPAADLHGFYQHIKANPPKRMPTDG